MDTDSQAKILQLVEKVEAGTASPEETEEFFRLFKIFTKEVERSIDEDVTRAKLKESY